MLKLVVLRHAESEWNPVGRYQGLLDPDLTDRGRRQAELLGEALKEEGISVLYSSPLKRTYETAKIVASTLGLEVVKEDRVIEIDHGVWSGMLVEEVKERFADDFNMWLEEPHRVEFPEGESLGRVYERVKGFIEDIKGKHEGETVAVVSHTVPIRCMYCALLDVELSKFWSFGCDNASISKVLIEEDRAIIQSLNITCHLGELYVEAHKAL